MDGVIADFIGRVRQVDPTMEEWAPDEKLWPVVNAIPNFWEDMPWTADGKKLWNHISHMDPVIVSAPSRNDVRSPSGKLVWIHRELGFDTHWVFTRASKKKLLAKPNRILIDDLGSNVEGWIRHGGIGILHRSANETIEKLDAVLAALKKEQL